MNRCFCVRCTPLSPHWKGDRARSTDNNNEYHHILREIKSEKAREDFTKKNEIITEISKLSNRFLCMVPNDIHLFLQMSPLIAFLILCILHTTTEYLCILRVFLCCCCRLLLSISYYNHLITFIVRQVNVLSRAFLFFSGNSNNIRTETDK